jgi:hypothetical protein
MVNKEVEKELADRLCWHCDNEIPDNDPQHIRLMASDSNLHVLCDSCDADMVKCNDCDEYLIDSDATRVDNFGANDGDYVCSFCLGSYNKCKDCGVYVSDDNFITDSEYDVYICQGCYDNNYFTCQDCDHIYHADNYAEDGHCEDCWGENHSKDEDDEPESGSEPEEPSPVYTSTSPGPQYFQQGGTLVHFECAVKTFYLMYALEERLSRKRSDLAYIVKKDLVVFSSKFARALFDYMAMACIGEARHAQRIPAELMIAGFFPDSGTPTRDEVYCSMASRIDPIASAPALSAVFGSHWATEGQGYGGPKWKSIADAYATYPDRISDISFIDMVINKRHNGSLAFDKGVVFKMPGGQSSILPFLDYRREYDVLDLAHAYNCSVVSGYSHFYPITPELYSLLECAVRERVVGQFPRIAIKLIDIRWAVPVRWGSVVLNACINEAYVMKMQRDKKDSETCAECGNKIDDCDCIPVEVSDHDQAEESTEGFLKGGYDGIYSEYRKTIKGMENVAGRNDSISLL